MKIISKYKDYYDYLVDHYGIDEKVTIDRTKGFVPFVSNPTREGEFSVAQVAVCGMLHSGLIDHKGVIHWGDSAIPFGKMRSKSWLDDGLKMLYFDAGLKRKDRIDPKPAPTDLNARENCAVVWVTGYSSQDTKNWPKLEVVNFAGYIPAEEMFQEIYSWMSARNEPDTTDTRDDATKLLNAGFDKKKSFRHRK